MRNKKDKATRSHFQALWLGAKAFSQSPSGWNWVEYANSRGGRPMLDTWKTFSRYWYEQRIEALGGETVSIYLMPGVNYGTFTTSGFSSTTCGYVCEFQNEANMVETAQESSNETTASVGSISMVPLQPKNSHLGKLNCRGTRALVITVTYG